MALGRSAIDGLMRGVAPALKDYVAHANAGILARIVALERRLDAVEQAAAREDKTQEER
jgi:hypothetical protein